jgi:hypothetical protein
MTETTSSAGQFQALLAEFCTEMQMPTDDQALGMEFEADGHIVLLAPDPRDDQRLQIEVSVMRLDHPSASLLLALHQLNHQSRLEHDWMLSVDVADQLTLHSQRQLQGCRPSDLQALLAEGIDRAQALMSLCQTLAEAPKPTAEPTVMTIDPAMMMIRG